MKKVNFILIGFLLIGLSTMTSAQKIKLISGSCDFMKGISELNLEYDYSDFGVGKFEDEADYVAKKKKEYNEDEPGRGDTWEKAWIADRSGRYEVRFEEEMNNQFEKRKIAIKAGKNLDAQYTLIFKTTFTEPGYNIYISRQNAYIDGEAIFVESANPDNVLAKIHIDNSPGRGVTGYDFDTGYRIQEAYAKAGKELVYFIWKKFLK